MKTITVLLDGIGDRSYKELGWKTPLQYAKTPNLDRLARESQCGLLTPLREGVSLGTDMAHLLLFGYSLDEYPGRAVIDLYGEDLYVNQNDLVLRASWANVIKENGYFLKSRFTKDLSDEEIDELCKALSYEDGGYEFKVLHSYDSHGFIIIKGNHLSPKISDSDPFYINQYVMAIEAFENDAEASVFTSRILNDYLRKSYDILNGHPVNKKRKSKGMELGNILLSKWAGMKKDVEAFYLRNGMTGLMLGKSKLLKGIAKYIDLNYEIYNDFEEGIERAMASDKEYIHLHTKDTDEASHKKDPLKKVEAIEKLDMCLKALMDFDGLLIVTADHSTPCRGEMIHSGESVPFMARGQYIRRDNVEAFNEIDCSGGSIFLEGKDYMHYIQNATDRASLYHLRAGKRHRNYRVRDVKPL